MPALALSLLLLTAAAAQAGSIEPKRAALTPGEDGYTLSAEFALDLGNRLEDAVARGVPLYFNLEFVLERKGNGLLEVFRARHDAGNHAGLPGDLEGVETLGLHIDMANRTRVRRVAGLQRRHPDVRGSVSRRRRLAPVLMAAHAAANLAGHQVYLAAH